MTSIQRSGLALMLVACFDNGAEGSLHRVIATLFLAAGFSALTVPWRDADKKGADE